MQISPILDFGAYRKALDYLDRLAVVTSFSLLAVTNDTMLLSFELNGTQDQLFNALSLDRKLRPRAAAQTDGPWMTGGGDASQPLRLEWVGR